jgi:hypothetical protein
MEKLPGDDPFGIHSHPFWTLIKWVYNLFKFAIIAALVVAFGSTTWCHNQIAEAGEIIVDHWIKIMIVVGIVTIITIFKKIRR